MTEFIPAHFFTVRDLLRKAFIVQLEMIGLFVLIFAFFPQKLHGFNWLFVFLPTLVSLARESRARRTVKLVFDSEQRLVLLTFRSLFTDPETKKLSYDLARLEYNFNPSRYRWFRWHKLYLLKLKMEVFEINDEKDNFTPADLEAILACARREGIIVEKY